MDNPEHLKILNRGVEEWNKWRYNNEDLRPELSFVNLSKADLRGADLRSANLSEADLRGADLRGANLKGADLRSANLSESDLKGADLTNANLTRADFYLSRTNLYLANLSEANLSNANLSEADLGDTNLSGADLSSAGLSEVWLGGANLSGADLSGADLSRADLSKANLSGADLSRADLSKANLSSADLSSADLTRANLARADLVQTRLDNANLTSCTIYGISVWDLKGKPKEQKDLIITPQDQPEVTVDNIKVAQFIYLLLENEEIRDVIDTLTSKSVLILGRFSAERKKILDNMKDSLRAKGYLPILFDFEKPASRDLTETIKTLASLSKFIIADITDAKSIPQELSEIVKDFPSIPVQPLILESQQEYAMFERFRRYPWVLDVYQYPSSDVLLANLENAVIAPAERKVVELKP